MMIDTAALIGAAVGGVVGTGLVAHSVRNGDADGSFLRWVGQRTDSRHDGDLKPIAVAAGTAAAVGAASFGAGMLASRFGRPGLATGLKAGGAAGGLGAVGIAGAAALACLGGVGYITYKLVACGPTMACEGG